MRVVVVYESLWGNTEQVARHIAAGFEDSEVTVKSVEDATIDPDTELVIVGGPTHAFSMSTEATRQSASQQGATDIPSTGIREWIDAQPTPAKPVRVATFTTRTVAPRLPGSAAKKAMKRLVARGFHPLAKPETFDVHGYTGPVGDGEYERARTWGAELAGLLPAHPLS